MQLIVLIMTFHNRFIVQLPEKEGGESMSEHQLSCPNCSYSWMPRGKEYSLRCPQCNAILPDTSGGKGIPSYVLIILAFVIVPAGLYLLWPTIFAPQPLPAPPVAASPVEVIPPVPATPAAAPVVPVDPKPAEKTETKPTVEVAPPQPTAEEIAERENKTAARKLSLVKPFVDRGENATARRRLKEIIDQHPETAAAKDARRMLEGLPK
jgi:hypothetical protein